MKDFREIVCHCGGITKGDIFKAAMLGARSIEDVKTLTGKPKQGECESKHPQGICCHPEFQREIDEYLEVLKMMERGLRGHS